MTLNLRKSNPCMNVKKFKLCPFKLASKDSPIVVYKPLMAKILYVQNKFTQYQIWEET